MTYIDMDVVPREFYSVSQQTRHIDPVLVQCWADVVDVHTLFQRLLATLVQHWVCVSCLLGWCGYPIRRISTVVMQIL